MMVQSMTAFSHNERQHPYGQLVVELRSINHRYLDIHPRLQEGLGGLEPMLRRLISDRINRGKVECSIALQQNGVQSHPIQLNKELATTLALATRELGSILYNAAPVSPLELLRWPGIMIIKAPNAEELEHDAQQLLQQSITALIEMRSREGEQLQRVIAARCSAMEDVIQMVTEQLPNILQQARERLLQRLNQLRQPQDDNGRLEQEMVILAQRLDVDEELERLRSHLAEVTRLLASGGAVGRRLDFMMQELTREANTLGSKSADITTTQAAVDMKVLIEQMREQIQNIE